MASLNRFRSTSYPPKSNPIIPKTEEELLNLRKSEASSTSVSSTIFIGLSGLTRLYKCIDDILTMPLLSHRTLSLSLSKHGNFFIQSSSKLLEICISSHHILQKFLYETQICSYFSHRKEMIQEAKALALQLRQVEESNLMVSRNNTNNNEEIIINDDFEVIRVLRCVSIINISVLDSLLGFMASSAKINHKSKKFGLFSNWVIKRSKKTGVMVEIGNNELNNVDVLLHSLEVERFEDNEFAMKRMEVLDVALRRIDDVLNNLIKQLKSTRTSVFNIISV